MARIAASLIIAALLLAGCAQQTRAPAAPEQRHIAVAFLVHGGFEGYSPAELWASTLQIFSYDPNSVVYQQVIWNPQAWPRVLSLGNAPKEQLKYAFSQGRIGGQDPAMAYSRAQLEDMRRALDRYGTRHGIRFITDYVTWIGDPAHLAHPRAIYQPQTPGGVPMRYCGSAADGGSGPELTWEGCDPERYNMDGTIDRLLKSGAQEIIVIDLTTSGVRFFKSYDVIALSRRVIDEWNAATGASVRLRWANDPGDLMANSYPELPAGWTQTLGRPLKDRSVPLDAYPNPVAADPELALLQAEGIEKRFNPRVPAARTGVVLVNHATRNHNQYFDPKINDTLVLNRNIRAALLERNPGMQQSLVVGAWMGRKTVNPRITVRRPGGSQLERSREMRGENLGEAWLYETDEVMPAGEWGYLYWDALEYLKNQGVEHIVVAFPQIMVDSVLNLVELPNQIAKEIGYRNWLFIDEPDFRQYPGTGHPFADYWGNWVDTRCPVTADPQRRCCFEMGGCADGRPYPPPRQAPLDRARDDLDPSLAFDVSEYGHAGYDPARGRPDASFPVQQQYRGSWATWVPPNTDPRVGAFLARKVIELLEAPAP